MKRITKWTAVLLAVLLAVLAAPAAFAAEDDVIASGSGGEGITWTLTKDGLLTVSGSGPIKDEEEIEYDDNGEVCSVSKLDCIGWQLNSILEQRTEGLDPAQAARARFDFVKEIVIQEGITDIPDDEFSTFYPRSITLPASLTTIRYGIVDASFAETLTILNRNVDINGNILISGCHAGAKPYDSLEEAIDAKIAFEEASEQINDKQCILGDGGVAYLITIGSCDYITAEEYIANFNEFYGTELESVDACLAYCLEKTNQLFGTHYESADALYHVVTDDGEVYAEYDPALTETISEMYEAIDISDRLDCMHLGARDEDDFTAYQWLTVCAPAGSAAEEAAKNSGVPFKATSLPEDNPFFFGLFDLSKLFRPLWNVICAIPGVAALIAFAEKVHHFLQSILPFLK